MKENQLSRWGAIAKHIPLMNPGAKLFLVAKTSLTFRGELDQEFPPDKDGDVRVVSTLSAAQSLTQANRGDVVLVLPGHTETLTATLSLSTAGVRYIGIGSGNLTPALTVDGTINGVGISGADVEFENFNFPAPTTDGAVSMIRCAAVGIKLKNIRGVGSLAAKNFLDCIVVKGGSHDMEWENIKLIGGNTAITGFIRFEGLISNFSAGYVTLIGSVATAGIYDDTGAIVTNVNWHDFNVMVGGAAKNAVVLDAGGAAGGIVRNSFFAGTGTTLASIASFAGDFRLSQVYLLEATGNTNQGALIPAADTD